MQDNAAYIDGVRYLIMTEAELQEQKEIAIMEHNIQEIKAGRRKTKQLDEYKKGIEKHYGRKIF